MAIEEYRQWLWIQIKNNNQEIIGAILDIKDDDELGCWCHPLPCHCEVIIKAREYLINKGYNEKI